MPPISPRFAITPKIASALLRIEAAREALHHLRITPALLATLRETARLFSTHYSTQAAGAQHPSTLLRQLDPRQRKVITLFRHTDTLTSRDVEKLFTLSQRTARLLLTQWTAAGLLVIADPARKSRKYALASPFKSLQP